MKNTCCRFCWIIVIVGVTACSIDEEPSGDFLIFSEVYDFSETPDDWQGGFSDYPAAADDSTFRELKFKFTEDPSSTDGRMSLMLSGNNLNDDLFMFLKKKITGLKPNSSYTITYDVEFSTNVKSASGTVDQNVYLKVGGAPIEPKSVIENGYHVMNISKGNHDQNGDNMIKIGTIATTSTAEGFSKVVVRSSSAYIPRLDVQTNSDGELWLIVGTDSAFRGTTTIYYTKISVVFSASKHPR